VARRRRRLKTWSELHLAGDIFGRLDSDLQLGCGGVGLPSRDFGLLEEARILPAPCLTTRSTG